MNNQNNTERTETKENQPTIGRPRAGFGGPGSGMHGPGGTEKAKDFKGTMRQFTKYLKPFWVSLTIVFAFAILSTVFSIFSPKILGNITNELVTDFVNMTVYDKFTESLPAGVSIPPGTKGADLLKMMPESAKSKMDSTMIKDIENLDLSKRPEINFDYIGQTAIVLIVLFLLSAGFSFIQGYIMSGVSQKITYEFRKQISSKINRLPLRYFDTRTHGEVLSRITNDIDTIGQSLNQSISQIITSVATILGILIMMLSISWSMTLVAILVLPLSGVSIMVIIKKSQKLFVKQQERLAKLNGHIEEMYSAHNVMKVFNGEKRSITKFNSINDKVYDVAWKSQFLSGLMWPMMNFISNLGYVGVAVLGGYLATQGVVNIGDIQAFIQYMRQFTQPIIQTSNIANILQSTAAAAERVFEFLGEKEEVGDIGEADITKADNQETKDEVPSAITIKGEVEFDNVYFGYSKDKTVIKGFSTKIKPGQRVAIVGPTGAGKTTIVNLLMRFYDVDKGAIKIDGYDIRDLKRSKLRRMFGMVLQETWLFNASIKENIVFGRQDASDKEINTVMKAARVDHVVHSLPGGFEFKINEEADNISQGEKQLLTIARAMLADPPMLILDEATSSVDTRTEVLIQEAMENLMKNRTSFVIAHRLSTIKDADIILVMKDGNIVEQGNHNQLLAQKGVYYTMYNSQFGDFDIS